MRLKPILFRFIAVILGFIIAAGLLEVALRIWDLRKRFSPQAVQKMVLDDKLGWRPNSCNFQTYLKDAAGEIYEVSFSTDQRGFRLFGDPDTVLKRVFCIGDSFTHAREVSDDKVYFSVLKNLLPVEVFAYGCGGYGTLQEFLVLDSYFDLIKPDVIILQVCFNDFINNCFELESDSCRNNVGMRRPYLSEAGEIFYATTVDPTEASRRRYKWSRFLENLVYRIGVFFPPASIEDAIEIKGRDLPSFDQAVRITAKIAKKIRDRVPESIPIIAFSSETGQPYLDEWKRIFSENGIIFADAIAIAVENAGRNGLVVRGGDRAHWSNQGHLVVGQQLSGLLSGALGIEKDKIKSAKSEG